MKSEQIITAAVEVFSSKGFYNAKMKEIAARAGVGKGTLYEYYSSKEELFKEIIKTGAQRFKEITEQQLRKEAPLWDKLQNTLEHQLDYLWENRGFTNLFMGRESQIITESEIYGFLYEARKEIMQIMEEEFQKAVEKEELAPRNLSLYVRMIQGVFSEVVVSSVLLENSRPEKEELQEYVDILRFGMEKSANIMY